MLVKFVKFVTNDNTIEGVLSQFEVLKNKLIEIGNRSAVRLNQIDAEITELEQEGIVETGKRDRAFKVADNISEVFKV